MFDLCHPPRNEDGEWDSDSGVEDYRDELMQLFVDAPEGTAYYELTGGIGWAHSFLYYSLIYVGSLPHELSVRDVDEVLFQLFPRKVSAEPDSAAEIISELRAFWEFLQREYDLANAGAILKHLDGNAERRLHRELANPNNFGMAKSFFAKGRDAGFDMTTQEGLSEFMLAYNASVMAAPKNAPSHALPPSASETKKPPVQQRLSPNERKTREKLRRKKLGINKGRR